MTEVQKSTFPNSTACVFQWNYPVINLGRNEYRNCCRSETTRIKADDISTYGEEILLNSPIEREKRARMLLGEKVKGCSSCWKIESQNARSPRADVDLVNVAGPIDFNSLKNQLDNCKSEAEKVLFLSQHPSTRSTQTNMLEIILTNTCDMKCMYCSHHYSTKWAAERIKYNEIKPQDVVSELPKPNSEYKRTLLEWFKNDAVHSINSINFIGGEPSLIKDFYEISSEIAKILELKSRNDVILAVVTNLNSSPAIFDKFVNHLISISKYFKFIDINISIEAFGSRAEYIRNGLSWNRWTENLEKLINLKLNNLKISAQMATNVLSISSLPQLVEYFSQLIDKNQVQIYLRQNLVTFPMANSPLLLTSEFVTYIDQTIKTLEAKPSHFEDVYKYDSWKDYIIFLNTIKDSIANHKLNSAEKKLVRDFFKQFDDRNSLDVHKTFPEYKNFFKECGLFHAHSAKSKKSWINKISNLFN
ncbi:MAG: radical SAM protein [Pseudobdellovibrio sp.]